MLLALAWWYWRSCELHGPLTMSRSASVRYAEGPSQVRPARLLAGALVMPRMTASMAAHCLSIGGPRVSDRSLACVTVRPGVRRRFSRDSLAVHRAGSPRVGCVRWDTSGGGSNGWFGGFGP